MKRASYKERDYAFAQLMLTLRTSTGLTQANLAALLSVSRHAVGGWEAGQSYPKAEHLKAFIALGFQYHIFGAGHEAEEIRALWRIAHQKMVFDESWLQQMLSQQIRVPVEETPRQKHDIDQFCVSPGSDGPRVDWGEALDVPIFYGREEELAQLSHWVVEERCRVISVLGMGGIGKSALAVTLMHHVATQFEVVIWRSLRDAPSCEALLNECLQLLAPQPLQDVPGSLDRHLALLMDRLRNQRVLLVLDNVEALLEGGAGIGRVEAGYEGYTRLLRQIGKTRHQSCLVLTSREKPVELITLEGKRSPVRALHLNGLNAGASVQVLAEKDVTGSPYDLVRLVELYQGNPLALQIVAQTIVDLFGGEIAPFLEQEEAVFGGVRELLDEQFARLSELEQAVFFWLAILREPVSLPDLQAVLSVPRTSGQLLEAFEGLRHRSMIERGQRAGSFTLQSVVLEYAMARLITLATSEIEQGHLNVLIDYGLCLAQAKAYVFQAQERLLVVPLLNRLRSINRGQANLEELFFLLLDSLRGLPQQSQGYGPANLVALLRVLRGNLRRLNLSRLILRGVSLQGAEMQDTSVVEATFQESVFTEPFDAITAIAISKSGQTWAAATWRGEVRVWTVAAQSLHLVWQAHSATVPALAFSPDGRQLASVSWDNTIKLWDVASGILLWTGWHTGSINWVAFAPDGQLLASSGNDALIKLWNPRSGANVEILSGQAGMVCSLAWSADGMLLASGCSDQSIWVWHIQRDQPAVCVSRLSGHTHWVTGLVFAPDGQQQMASASEDGTVRLWDLTIGDYVQTFSGQAGWVLRVAWSPDGRMLASGSSDSTIWLWDVKEGSPRMVLHGHTSLIYTLAFVPNGRTLFSGSSDGTIRMWDTETGQCLRIIKGYANALFDLDWSPDGTQLVSGGADTLLLLWDGVRASVQSVFHGHRWTVQGIAWRSDGQFLASAGYDNLVGIWDGATGGLLQMLRDSDAIDTMFLSVAWSPDQHLLASGTYLRGVQVWETTTYTRCWIGQTPQPTVIRRIAWSPDGTCLAGGGDDSYVYVWNATDGAKLLELVGHSGAVLSVAWSPDGRLLASAGGGSEGGEIFLWEARSGKHVQVLRDHSRVITTIAWSLDGERVMSGDGAGTIRWWEVQSGQCTRMQKAHQGTVQALKLHPDGNRLASCGDDGAIMLWNPYSGEHLQTLRRDRPYERLDITGIRGLTEAQKASLFALGAFEKTNANG